MAKKKHKKMTMKDTTQESFTVKDIIEDIAEDKIENDSIDNNQIDLEDQIKVETKSKGVITFKDSGASVRMGGHKISNEKPFYQGTVDMLIKAGLAEESDFDY